MNPKDWKNRTELEKFGGILRKMEADPSFIAYWFGRWCRIYGRRLADVANELCSSEDIVVHIMMCAAPREGDVYHDLKTVANRFQVHVRALALLVLLCQPELPPVAVKRGRNVQLEHLPDNPEDYPPELGGPSIV